MMEDMDRLFDNFGLGSVFGAPSIFGGSRESLMPSFGSISEAQAWTPQIEVAERDGKLVVKADLPGMTSDDVRIEVLDDALLIEGERSQERREDRGDRHYTERSYGTFTRTVPLPPGVQPEDCEASFEDGVLHIELKLPQRSRGRSVEIKSRSASGGTQGASSAGGSQTDKERPS